LSVLVNAAGERLIMGEQIRLQLDADASQREVLEALRALLPGAFAEGELSADRLLERLGLKTSDTRDLGYSFRWAGRAEAFAAARGSSGGALIPDRAASVAFDEAHHVLIEGDNLEVLKLLRQAYGGSIKAILLDPPYNTAHDLIYEDDYADGLQAYLRQTEQVDEAGDRRSSRAEVDGRKHSRWLSMMAPRLEVARSLLRPDGCVFVCVDHTESHHLRMLMNEVFGEENFVAQIAWQKRYTRANNTERFTSVVDQILLYQRSAEFKPNLLPRTDRDLTEFRNPDDDPRGPWKLTSFLNQVPPERRPNLVYPVTNPNTGVVTHNDRKAWRVNRAGYERLLGENRLWWGRAGTRAVPQVKTFLSEVRQGLTPINFWSYEYAGTSDRAHDELKELFGKKIFDTPKPTLLIRRMLEHATGPDDLVLDFFAGSGTTAAAVMDLNAQDGGRRRAILVQLPETIEGEGAYKTICDITRERVRREGAARADVLSEAARGFRAFRLGASGLPRWPKDLTEGELEAALGRAGAGASSEHDEALLFEALLMAGFPLDSALNHTEVAGKSVTEVANKAMVVSLERTLDDAFFEALATRGYRRVIVRDASFADDQARLRASVLLKPLGVRLETL
jgi:adenine-specific DNA-methyltransferase